MDLSKRFQYKDNVDDAVNVQFNHTTIRFIVRDCSRLMIGSFARKIGHCTILFVESQGIRYAMEWVWNEEYRNVIIKINSTLNCQIVQNPHM